MNEITYTDKVALNENASIPDINKVKASDMNEIKSVVNGNSQISSNNFGLGTNTWTSSATYSIGDIVVYNSNTYKNLTGTNTNITPDQDSTNWEVIPLIVNEKSDSTKNAYSCDYINNNLLNVIDITSKITKTSNVGTLYSLDAYKKGSRCYLNTIFDLNAVGNVFTIDNSILPKYGEIATGTNYDTASMATCTARISTNNANISVEVYGTKKDYVAMHIEWEA